jgi:RND family efflux transporter MFP subunit
MQPSHADGSLKRLKLMTFLKTAMLGIAAFAFVALFQPLSAHEGHNDVAPPPPTQLAPRVEASSKQFELVAVVHEMGLDIHLDAYTTNAPITHATITIDTPDGSVAATPDRTGTYRIAAPWVGKPGTYPLVFDIAANGQSDILTGTLTVPVAPAADPTHAVTSAVTTRGGPWLIGLGGFALGLAAMAAIRRKPAAVIAIAALALLYASQSNAAPNAATTQDRSQRLTDGSVLVPKVTQRILAIRTMITTAAPHRRAIEMPGRIVPDPNASGLVQAAVGGRLSAPEGGFPQLGTRVKAGDVLAYVTPPLQAIDLSDMRQRQGELDQQISIVERRVARLSSLVPYGAATATQLDESKLELEGLKTRRASLDRARRDSEALIAPVDGLIAEASATAGQIASPNAIVYRIVDPKRLWIEALSFIAISNGEDATARLSDEKTLALVYAGAGFADRNQSVPVNFAIKSDTTGLRLGQFVTVLAPTGDTQTGIAVPRASVVRGSNGQDVIYAHVSAERFVPLAVRTEPLDADNVLIASGLNPDTRIVTQGAEMLAQIR